MIQKYEEINPLNGCSDVKNTGKVRSNIHCHECSNTFIAELDFDINGDHSIICPWCEHTHCRTIKDGFITGERWSTKPDRRIEVDKRSVWKSGIISDKKDNVISGHTSTVAQFIRDLWLNGKDLNVG